MIEIYGAAWCTYCVSAKELCESRGLDYLYYDIDDTDTLRNLEARVGGKIRSVPQIFLDGEHVQGGFSGLKAKLS